MFVDVIQMQIAKVQIGIQRKTKSLNERSACSYKLSRVGADDAHIAGVPTTFRGLGVDTAFGGWAFLVGLTIHGICMGLMGIACHYESVELL